MKRLPIILVAASSIVVIYHYGWRRVSSGAPSGQAGPLAAGAVLSPYGTKQPISLATLCQLAAPGLPERGLAQIWTVVQNLDAATVKKLALEIPQHRPKDEAWEQVRQAVLERWLEVDSKGVILAADGSLHLTPDFLKARALAEAAKLPFAQARQFLLQIPHASFRQETMAAFVSQLAQRSIADARTFTAGLEPGQCRSAALAALAGVWAKQDSAAAMAWIDSLEPTTIRSKLKEEALSELTEQDPMAALAIRSKLGEKVFPYQLSKCHETDPAGTMAWINSQPLGVREKYLATLVNVSSSLTLDDKLSLVLSMPISDSRKMGIEQLARKWGKEDPAKGWSWIAKLGESDQSVALAELCRGMGSRPIAEIEKLLPIFPEHLAETVAEGIADGLPFNEASHWIDRVFQDPAYKKAVSLKLLERESDRFSPETADWALQLEPGPKRDQLLGKLLGSGLGQRGGDESFYTWLDGAPQAALKVGFAEITDRLNSSESPDAGLDFIVKYHERAGLAPEQLSEALAPALSPLITKSPASALERVNTLPVSLRPAASAAVVEQWTQQDPKAAVDWTVQQDDPALVRAAIGSLGRAGTTNIDAMAKLSTKLPDADEAFELLQPNFQVLRDKYAESAAAALKAHPFTEAQLKALNEGPKPNE